jgi:photosystem II stability/assembly factor-like uncharacterized protein
MLLNIYYYMGNKIIIVLMLLAGLILPTGICFSQEVEFFKENESSEEILAREQFFLMRRAGGEGKVLPLNAYEDALHQKSLLQRDRDVLTSLTRMNNWISINPIGMFYVFTNNNYISGRTNAIAFHPTDPNIIYIAAAQGGAWKTTDGGVNWTQLTDNLPTLACGDIAIDKNNPNILYLGTGELNYSGDSQYGNGIYKSTNAGATWFQIAAASLVSSRCSQISIDPSNSNIIYMAGGNGVFKSTNAGINWVNTNSGTNANCVLINPLNTNIIYCAPGGTSAGTIKKSTDGAATWTTLSGGLPSGMGRIQLALVDSFPDVIYASISNSSGALVGLYRTNDGGLTWIAKATTPNYLSSQGWYDNSIAVKPNDTNYVIVGGLDVYNSTTQGADLTKKSNWSTTNKENFCHADIHRLLYNGSVLYCCSDGGVYKSTNNGTNWTDLNHTLSTLQYQSADYNPANLLTFHGGTQDNNKQYTTDGGTSWLQRTTGDGGYTIVDPVSTNYIYGQYVNGSIQRSANNGTSYTDFTPSGSTGGLFYNPYEMAPGDHNTIVFGRANVWKTTNAQTATTSSGWTQIATTSVVGGSVSAIGISATDINKIYLGTSNGRILVTTDNGTTWKTKTGYQYISDFIVDNTNDAVCYATLAGASAPHVLKTTDYGDTWTNITGDIPNIAANSIVMKTAPDRTLFVGTDIGVFKSTNDGVNWISFNSGLPAVEIYDMKYKQSVGLLLVATHGRGCWTFDLNVTGIDPFGQIPSAYNLKQNYPNPFNPSTNIEFDIPKSESVTLAIYDLSGRKIAEPVNGNFNAGHYQIQWNASNFSSGVYVYKLTTPSFSDTKRMVLVK